MNASNPFVSTHRLLHDRQLRSKWDTIPDENLFIVLGLFRRWRVEINHFGYKLCRWVMTMIVVAVVRAFGKDLRRILDGMMQYETNRGYGRDTIHTVIITTTTATTADNTAAATTTTYTQRIP
jgi:hypothetical protein